MDVKTRWNSTLSMINRVLQFMQPINDFIAFYKSPQGRKEFKGKKTTMVQLLFSSSSTVASYRIE